MDSTPSREPDRRRRPWSAGDGLGCLAAICVGALLRLPDVERAFLFGDELHSLSAVSRGYGFVLGHFSPTGAGMALPLLQRIAIDLSGPGHWAIRAPAWIAGLALLPAVALVTRRWLGGRIALGATWLVAVSPLLVFYSHFARAYAAVVLLAVLLLHAVQGIVDAGRATPRGLAAVALLAAALPWAHPTALSTVVPVVLAGTVALLGRSDRPATGRRRAAAGLLGALALGGLLCIGIHWPAADSLEAFVSAKTRTEYAGAFGPLDVAALVAGGRWVAASLGGLALGGGLWLARRCGPRAWPLLAAALAPAVVIAVVRPFGDAYAYARYVIAAIPPLLVLAAVALDRLARRGPRPLRAHGALLTAGVAGIVLVAGPPDPLTDPAPQHANTYLSLYALPAFDAPWPDTPAFYRSLAAEAGSARARSGLIELPALTSRARHLYRHYQLQHGRVTWLAPLPGEFPLLPDGPYVAIAALDRLAASGAEYLVVHRDVAAELARYWAWVYGPEGPPVAAAGRAYMARHERYGGLLPRPSPALVAALTARFGEPVFVDDTLLVYRVASRADSAGGSADEAAPRATGAQDSAPSTSRS
jgi:hypothetical protein